MPSLFNEYESAVTPHAEGIARKTREFTEVILRAFPEYLTREVEQLMTQVVSNVCGEERLRRSVEKKRRAREKQL